MLLAANVRYVEPKLQGLSPAPEDSVPPGLGRTKAGGFGSLLLGFSQLHRTLTSQVKKWRTIFGVTSPIILCRRKNVESERVAESVCWVE